MLNMTHVLADLEPFIQDLGQYQKAANVDKAFEITQKDSEINLVTAIDIESEKRIKAWIWAHYPDHAILGEEGEGLVYQDGSDGQGADYVWVIDPIDGTTNFVHGFPLFCISVALKYQGVTQLGLVHAPVIQWTFKAIAGQGAFLNDQAIQVSTASELVNGLIATGFPYNRATENVNQPYFNAIVNQVSGIRRTGSAALDLCFVAAGKTDGYWEFGVNEWDIAAGMLIIREAGGQVEAMTKKGYNLCIAGNQVIQGILKSYLED